MPIEHVVIIVKENHTFDNYFGTLPGADGQQLGPAPNPPPVDPPHDHLTWMHRAGDSRFHVQYTSDDIPDYFSYAKNYAVCDRYFSEVAGPSTPNHLMLICADAPIINNPQHQYNPRPGQGYNLPSLPAQLERAGLQWGNYGGTGSITSTSSPVIAATTPAICLCMMRHPAGCRQCPGSMGTAGPISVSTPCKMFPTACDGRSIR